ncbi:MAG: sigma-70 family RNA polymerase sigma factor [Armatimonadota bacterium]
MVTPLTAPTAERAPRRFPHENRSSLTTSTTGTCRLAPLGSATEASLTGTSSRNIQSLVAANDRLAQVGVDWFLRRFHVPKGLGLEREDLISEARLALCHAARAWDPDRGAFSTYARTAIHNWLLRVCRLNRNRQTLRPQLVSLSAPVGETEEDSFMDLLPDPDVVLDEQVCQSHLSDSLHQAIQELPEREREILQNVLRGRATSHIAQEQGCSRQRIEQIQSRAVRRLRERLGDWAEANAVCAA